jgi:hypothetical protein
MPKSDFQRRPSFAQRINSAIDQDERFIRLLQKRNKRIYRARANLERIAAESRRYYRANASEERQLYRALAVLEKLAAAHQERLKRRIGEESTAAGPVEVRWLSSEELIVRRQAAATARHGASAGVAGTTGGRPRGQLDAYAVSGSSPPGDDEAKVAASAPDGDEDSR